MAKIYMRGGVYFGTAEDMIDRIEELEASLQDAHRVGAEWFEQSKQNHKRATTSEAKLAKAVEALDEAWFMLTVPHLNYEPEPEEPGLRRIKTALAELKERTQ